MRGEDDSAEVKLQREMSALDERLRRASTSATSRRRGKEDAAPSSPVADGGRSDAGGVVGVGVTKDNGAAGEGDGGEPGSDPTYATSTATDAVAEPSDGRDASADAADTADAVPGKDEVAQEPEKHAGGDDSGEGTGDVLDSQEQALREDLEHLNTQLLLKRPSTSSSRGGRWNRRIQPRR